MRVDALGTSLEELRLQMNAQQQAAEELSARLASEAGARREAITEARRDIAVELRLQIAGRLAAQQQALEELSARLAAEADTRREAITEAGRDIVVELRLQIDAQAGAQQRGLEELSARLASEAGTRREAIAETGREITLQLRLQMDAQAEAQQRGLEDLSARLAAETDARREAIAETGRQITAELRQHMGAQVEAQQRGLEELSARLAAEADTRREAIADTARQIAAHAATLDAERRTRFLLERLVTDSFISHMRSPQKALADAQSPIVSIILPTWNRSKIVVDAISSVQAQQFTDWELLVIDDGSSDDTQAAIAPYLSDSRITYIYQTNEGSSAARNRGLAEAKGTLVAYIDSDNMWYPGFLCAAVAAFTADVTLDSAYAILVTDNHFLAHTRLLWQAFDREQLLRGNFIDMNVFVHRRALIDRCGNFDLRLTRVNDWDLILRLTEHSPARALPVLGALYRRCDERRLTDTLPLWNEEVIVRDKWYPDPGIKLRPRVLYLADDDPETDAGQITDEIACMRRWGVNVDICDLSSSGETGVPPDEAFEKAVASGQPDLIHVHGLKLAAIRLEDIVRFGIPITVRAHASGFDVDAVRTLLASPLVRRIWIQPHHIRYFNPVEGRTPVMPAIFDATSFSPIPNKDRQLILFGPQPLHDDGFPWLDRLVSRTRGYRFAQGYGLGDDGVRAAGIYLCTPTSRHNASAAVMAAQATVLQALATGAQIILPDVPEAAEYADVAATYGRIEDVADMLERLQARTELEWRDAVHASINYVFSRHSDLLALRPIFEDWCSAISH